VRPVRIADKARCAFHSEIKQIALELPESTIRVEFAPFDISSQDGGRHVEKTAESCLRLDRNEITTPAARAPDDLDASDINDDQVLIAFLSQHIGRDIVVNAAVDKFPAVDLNRFEYRKAGARHNVVKRLPCGISETNTLSEPCRKCHT
jgi:hypothetical protein